MQLLEAIENNILLLDGATGTELAKRGIMGKADANLTSPDVVLEVQRQYAQCGCDAITANTFMFNRIYIETHNEEVPIRELNIAGVEIAREAIGAEKYVLGNLKIS